MEERGDPSRGQGPDSGGAGRAEKEARRVVRRAAVSAAAAAAFPVPLGGFVGVPALQARMLVEVSEAFGRPLGLREARDLAGLLGGAAALRYLGRLVARAAARVVPAVGCAAGAASAFGSTFALGLAAIRYFRPGEEGLAAGVADSEGFEREARTLQLEWESGAISEETYRKDLEALREKFLSARDDPPDAR
ncbi:MAG: DUF697 domain-containing protein [Candidatus Tectomicrobia bacterium]|nr:DUF697 domain-containing protein [Candidatus Tectomicrobia bacterium]